MITDFIFFIKYASYKGIVQIFWFFFFFRWKGGERLSCFLMSPRRPPMPAHISIWWWMCFPPRWHLKPFSFSHCTAIIFSSLRESIFQKKKLKFDKINVESQKLLWVTVLFLSQMLVSSAQLENFSVSRDLFSSKRDKQNGMKIYLLLHGWPHSHWLCQWVFLRVLGGMLCLTT